MATYKIHPLCEKFPAMPDEEFKALVEDMRINGQRDPIWVYGKTLLDGKHRLEACEVLGRKPDVREFHTKHGPEEPQIKAFVLSKNFFRRHMTTGQRSLIAAELVTTNGAGQPKRITENSVITQEEAATAAGISIDSVQQADKVLESGSKALQEAVRDGDVSVSDAAKVADLPKSDQNAAVKAVQSGEEKTVAAAAGVKRRPRKNKPQPLPIPEREPGEDPTEPQHDPKRPTDKSGNALPDRPQLLKAFASRDWFVSSEKARSVIYNNAYEIAKLIPDGKAMIAAVEKHMKALFHTLASFEPAYVCKGCNGGGCGKCGKRGYTTMAK